MSDLLKLSTALPGDQEINSRETCLRCGWVQYQPADTLDERMEAAGLGKDDAPTLSLVGGVGRSDVGEVFVFEGGEPE